MSLQLTHSSAKGGEGFQNGVWDNLGNRITIGNDASVCV